MIYFYDLETYPNFFLATFKNRNTGAFYEFEISNRTNDTVRLRNFLKQPKLRLVGFNNLNFDYPILHKTILHNNQIWTAEDIYEQVKVIYILCCPNLVIMEYSFMKYRIIKFGQQRIYMNKLK